MENKYYYFNTHDIEYINDKRVKSFRIKDATYKVKPVEQAMVVMPVNTIEEMLKFISSVQNTNWFHSFRNKCIHGSSMVRMHHTESGSWHVKQPNSKRMSGLQNTCGEWVKIFEDALGKKDRGPHLPHSSKGGYTLSRPFIRRTDGTYSNMGYDIVLLPTKEGLSVAFDPHRLLSEYNSHLDVTVFGSFKNVRDFADYPPSVMAGIRTIYLVLSAMFANKGFAHQANKCCSAVSVKGVSNIARLAAEIVPVSFDTLSKGASALLAASGFPGDMTDTGSYPFVNPFQYAGKVDSFSSFTESISGFKSNTVSPINYHFSNAPYLTVCEHITEKVSTAEGTWLETFTYAVPFSSSLETQVHHNGSGFLKSHTSKYGLANAIKTWFDIPTQIKHPSACPGVLTLLLPRSVVQPHNFLKRHQRSLMNSGKLPTGVMIPQRHVDFTSTNISQPSNYLDKYLSDDEFQQYQEGIDIIAQISHLSNTFITILCAAYIDPSVKVSVSFKDLKSIDQQQGVQLDYGIQESGDLSYTGAVIDKAVELVFPEEDEQEQLKEQITQEEPSVIDKLNVKVGGEDNDLHYQPRVNTVETADYEDRRGQRVSISSLI